ncbi:MAG: hypothetical protein COA45_08665 [Zetaproteobacteria bacterium]|nr:MAG: hypothetical protein COA45_08665 [Zetaproteobacteria bacterium]
MDLMTDILPLVGLLMSLGVVAGFLAGLLGVGGGIILVPGLYAVFNLLQPNMGFDAIHLMHMSVGTSLAIIIPTGLSSALAHHRRGGVDLYLVKVIGSGVVFGVIIATWIAKGLDAQSMKMIFASAILILAGVMIVNPARFQISKEEPKQPFSSLAGLIIGGLSTLIGIGGATLSVPYLSLHGVSMHRAVGSASALGLVIAVPATIGFMVIGSGQSNLPLFSIGYVNFMAWIAIIPVSVSVAPLGVRVAHRISVKRLKVIFAFFMMAVALNMWRKILMGV